MKEDIYGNHFVLILGYEYLKQKIEQEKECKKSSIWFNFALNH
jgi:hypothetical protein